MSDPILKWLNNDAKLSKKITNIEQDFANGKLFAEILAKYHQKVSVSTFSNSYFLPVNLQPIHPFLENNMPIKSVISNFLTLISKT